MADGPEERDGAVGAAYSGRAEEYAALFGALAQQADDDVRRITAWRDATAGPLLDAGCGPGHWTVLLGADGREAIGIDVSAGFLVIARTHPGPRFLLGSFRALPFADGVLGGILAWYSLIHLPPEDLPAVLDEFARVLGDGGGLLIGYADGPAGEPFDHAVATAWYHRAEELGELLAAAGFTVTDHETRRDEGHRPHGSIRAVRRAGRSVTERESDPASA